jgi:hypothetical protein
MSRGSLLKHLYQEEIYLIKPKVLVVINKPWVDVTEDEAILLEKILRALKLSLAAVQVVERSVFSPGDFDTFAPRYIIAFGSTLKGSDKLYEEIKADKTTVVIAHSLNELDEMRKRNLWVTLKQVFRS